MNILVVTDDGKNAYGWRLLMDLVKRRHKDCHVVGLCTDRPMPGQAMSITPANVEDLEIKKLEKNVYEMKAKPIDLIYRAFLYPQEFIQHGKTWDMVLSGINHGQNIGVDLLHSGTVGMALFAANYFGCGAAAFSQFTIKREEATTQIEDRKKFPHAEKWVYDFLGMYNPIRPGECFNINIPLTKPKAWKYCRVAVFSRFRPHKDQSSRYIPGTDAFELDREFATVSEIHLNIDVPLNY